MAKQSTQSELAEIYGVALKTIQRWKKLNAPLHDVAKLATWATTQRTLPNGFLARITAMRDANDPAAAAVAAASPGKPSDPEWEAFCQSAKPTEANDRSAAMQALVRARDFAAFKFEIASKAGDRASMKFFGDLLAKFEGTVHDAELRAQRLGRDLGESFSAADVRRLGQSVGYWLMHGADGMISQIAKGIAESPTQPIDREGVRRIVEPLVLASRVLEPMQRSTEIRAGVALPPVFVDAMREGLASVVEISP